MLEYVKLIRRQRNFRRLWIAQLISELGDWFNNIAVLGLALQLTGSGVVVSAVWISRFTTALLTGPVAGIIVDRFDRKRILILSDLIRAILAVGYLWITSGHLMWVAYALGAVMMGVSTFFTPARSATLPNIVPRGDLTAANALMSSTSAMSVMLGSALGALIISQFGYGMAFLLNGLSFLFSAGLIYGMKIPPTARGADTAEHPSFLESFKTGMHFIRGARLVQWIMFLGIGWATCGGVAQVLFAIIPVQVFRMSDAAIGWLYAAAGLGIVTGASLCNRYLRNVRGATARWVVGGSFILYGLFYSLFSQAPTFTVAAVLIFCSRMGAGVALVLNTTFLMKSVPDWVRGRVFSAIDTLVNTSMVASILVAGVSSHYFDPRAIGTVAGLLPALIGVAWLGAAAGGRLPEPGDVSVSG